MFGSYLWFCRVLFVARGPWVRLASGLPCALRLEEGAIIEKTRTHRVARTERHARRHVAIPREHDISAWTSRSTRQETRRGMSSEHPQPVPLDALHTQMAGTKPGHHDQTTPA
jgi:hypothetical protein